MIFLDALVDAISEIISSRVGIYYLAAIFIGVSMALIGVFYHGRGE